MTQHTVLVVEDDSALNDAYTTILESADYDVKHAENGKIALEMLDDGLSPDVILLDMRMPVLDGIGFLKQYDASKHPQTKIVVFSNYDTHDDIEEAYELGVHRYVLKARLAPKELLRLVEGVVAERV